MWPRSAEELVAAQRALAAAAPPAWTPPPGAALAIGACAVRFPRGGQGRGAAGDAAWAAAVVVRGRRVLAEATVTGEAAGPYAPGLLALREGPLLQAAGEALAVAPDVLLVDATGRDHPRRAGLALHLGAVLGVPTVGVTHRPLLASGDWPGDVRGASAPLVLDGEPVGAWLRTRAGVRPLAVHAGWRTTVEVAVEVVTAAVAGHRTPEPLRRARRLARLARATYARPVPLPEGPHADLLREAIATEGRAHRALLDGDGDAATAAFREAVRLYRASWEAAPPGSFGRLIGMLKAAVIAGAAREEAGYAREQIAPDASSPPARYAVAIAALVVGDDREAARAAAGMRAGSPAFGRTADAIVALAERDAAAYERALAAIVADFEAREEHLTGVPIADTALMLERLAAERGIAARPASALLPA